MKGRKSPWLGAKNIWKLFYKVNLLTEETFNKIQEKKPKVIITFGNQVNSIILNKKISVSENRKICHELEINKNKYTVYYPVGNGIFNIDKSIDDIKWIIDMEIKEEVKK